MYIRFDSAGRPVEAAIAVPADLTDFVEVEDATFETLDRYRLVDGAVVEISEEQIAKEQAIRQARVRLIMNLQELRGQIDLAQSVAELTKKVDLTVQMLHALVTANNLKAALPEAEQVRYDETVAAFAGPLNIMNVYDYRQTLTDIANAYAALISQIEAYYVRKLAIYAEFGLQPEDVNF